MLRKILPVIIIVLSLISCSNQQKNINEEIKKEIKINANDTLHKQTDTVTKKIIKVDIKPQKAISGKATFSNGYCGGVRPSDEMLKEAQKERPLTYTTVLLKNVKTKKEHKITTDNTGKFKAELDLGSYDYFMTEKYNKNMGASFRSSCDVWMKRCFGRIKVTEGKEKGYNLYFGFGCNPCEPPRP